MQFTIIWGAVSFWCNTIFNYTIDKSLPQLIVFVVAKDSYYCHCCIVMNGLVAGISEIAEWTFLRVRISDWVMDRALLETISQACCERVGSASYIIPRLHIFACSNIGLSDGQGITRDDIPSVWKGWFSIIHHTHHCDGSLQSLMPQSFIRSPLWRIRWTGRRFAAWRERARAWLWKHRAAVCVLKIISIDAMVDGWSVIGDAGAGVR
jgi:hypothetical protein